MSSWTGLIDKELRIWGGDVLDCYFTYILGYF